MNSYVKVYISLVLAMGCAKNKKNAGAPTVSTTINADATDSEFLMQIYIKNICTVTNAKISDFELTNAYVSINGEDVEAKIGPTPKAEISTSDAKFIGVYRSKFSLIEQNAFRFRFLAADADKDVIGESNRLAIKREDYISELGEGKFIEANAFRVTFILECPDGDSRTLALSREKLELAQEN